MKLIFFVLVIDDWLSPIPRSNGIRALDSTVMLSDTHTPSIWWLPLNHELGYSGYPFLSYSLSIIPKCFISLPKEPFWFSRWNQCIELYLPLDSHVFTAFSRPFINSFLRHLNFLLCPSHLFCLEYTANYPPISLLGRQGMKTEISLPLTPYLP